MKLRLLVLALVGVAALFLLSGPRSSGQVPLFPEGLTLYRGNLHSHSDYSGDLPPGARGLSAPFQVYLNARVGRWDFWAITDHTAQPCAPGYGPTLRLSNTAWASLRADAQSATDNGQFVALAGFEWTGTDTRRDAGGDCDSSQLGVVGVGHMNVIEPNAETVQGAHYNAAGRLSEDEIYTYLRSLLLRSGARIFQFNHPDIYPRTTNFSGRTTQPFRLGPDLQDINNGFTALMELGNGWYVARSRGVPREIRLLYNNRAEDEFRDALANGWYVGATNNQDNHAYPTGLFPPNHTGLWAASLTRTGILDAIQARRVFASEDRTFDLWFTANDAPMGAKCVPNRGGTIEFRIRLRDGEPSDGVFRATIIGGRINDRRSVRVKASRLRPEYGDNLRVPIPYEGNSFYYLWIEQSDGDLIYSSPVWTNTSGVCAQPTPTPTPTPAPTPTSPPATLTGEIVFIGNVYNGDPGIFMIRPDGTNLRQVMSVLRGQPEPSDPNLSPDRRQIAFRYNNGLWIVGVDGTGLRRLVEGTLLHPAWSPDGTRLAFIRYPEYRLYIVNSDGSGLRGVFADEQYSRWPNWSPDGTQLALGGNDGVTIVTVDGGVVRRFAVAFGVRAGLSWSPDGQRMAVTVLRPPDYRSQICLFSVDGREMGCVTSDPLDAEYPSWGPGSVWIAFKRGAGSGAPLYLADSSTRALRFVYNEPGDGITLPHWR